VSSAGRAAVGKSAVDRGVFFLIMGLILQLSWFFFVHPVLWNIVLVVVVLC
jgi:hypothetical protein